ncbi:ketopantoate reductase family protein [Amycolatopsis benzoatilytica]|uniref:ketopantoate reductase family protein n=1 Tax=Amycolatopsis benzoatilytica TaxID=346045 RepID=UPI00037C3ABB|nr:2-dehydropantoate 2-reductase [Amycolatopsis benzoatilytica]
MGSRVTVVGPGGVGAVLAAACLAAGGEVSVLGRRGPHLAAIADRGLQVSVPGEPREVRLRVPAASEPAELPEPDLVVMCVKSQDLAAAARGVRGWLEQGAELLVVVNGVPWWLPSTVDAFGDDPVLRSVDPEGALLRLLPPGRAMAGVAHFTSAVAAPGHVTHTSGTKLLIGDPLGGVTDRIVRCAEAFSGSDLDVAPVADIRVAVWEKLLGNVNLNPISALTGATVADILDDRELWRLCSGMFDEAAAVGAKLGIPTPMTAGQRLDIARQLGAFRTSMLQDAEAGRPLELAAIVGAVRELALRTGVPSPLTDAVHALLACRERLPGATSRTHRIHDNQPRRIS